MFFGDDVLVEKSWSCTCTWGCMCNYRIVYSSLNKIHTHVCKNVSFSFINLCWLCTLVTDWCVICIAHFIVNWLLMSFVALDAFGVDWCRKTNCRCKAMQDSMRWKGMQEKRAQVQQVLLLLSDWQCVMARKLGRDSTQVHGFFSKNLQCEQLASQEN